MSQTRRFIKPSITRFIADAAGNPAVVASIGAASLSMPDNFNTIKRNLEVFEGAFHTDSTHGPSLEHTDANIVHASSFHAGRLTSVGGAIAGGTVAATVGGIVASTYAAYHKRHLESVDYTFKRINKINKQTNRQLDAEQVEEILSVKLYQSLKATEASKAFYKKKIAKHIQENNDYNQHLYYRKQNNQIDVVSDAYTYLKRDWIDLNYTDGGIEVDVNDAFGVRSIGESRPKKRETNHFFQKIIALANSKFGQRADDAFKLFSGTAFLFWAGWALVSAFAGVAVASGAFVIGPLFLGALAIVGGVAAWKKYSQHKLDLKKEVRVDDLAILLGQIGKPVDKLVNQFSHESRLMLERVKSIHELLSKNDSQYQKAGSNRRAKAKMILSVLEKMEKMDVARLNAMTSQAKQEAFMRGESEIYNKLFNDLNINATATRVTNRVQSNYDRVNPEGKELVKSQYRSKLLGSNVEHNIRAGITFLNNLIKGVIIPAFMVWIFGAAITALSLPFLIVGAKSAGLAAITSFIGANTPIIVHSLGGLLGSLFGIKALARIKASEAAHKNNTEAKIVSEYKNSGKSKLDVFVELESKFNAYKEACQNSGDGLVKSRLNRLQKNGYDLKSFDVHNDYYFEKQKARPTFKSMLKKIGKRILIFTGGSGSIFTLKRFMFFVPFLGAGLLALSPIGAPLAVAIIAASIGVAYGITNLVKYQLDKRQQNRGRRLDDGIKFMTDRVQEMQKILGEKPQSDYEMINVSPDAGGERREQTQELKSSTAKIGQRMAKNQSRSVSCEQDVDMRVPDTRESVEAASIGSSSLFQGGRERSLSSGDADSLKVVGASLGQGY